MPTKSTEGKAPPEATNSEVPDVPATTEQEPFDDATTGQAVDDIMHEEGDELLDAEDAQREAQPLTPPRRGFWRTLARPVVWWWRHHFIRLFTVVLLLGGLVAGGLTPNVRYWVLNHAGVRVSASVRVLDNATGLPLKGISFKLDTTVRETNDKGVAAINNLTLGAHHIRVSQPGFATISKTVVLGLGSNPLGDFELRSVGVQYTVLVTDYITGQPIQGAEVTSDDAAATSDKQGKAIVTLPGTETGIITLMITSSGHRPQAVTVKALNTAPITVRLVTTRKAVYVSKQSGKYDVTSSDIDGQNKKVILPGTGNEDSNISLIVSPDGSRAAVISTRDNQRDDDGFLLSTLTVIGVSDGTVTTVARAEQLQFVDWIGTHLVFEQASTDPKTPASSRYAIISYDHTDNSRLQLASGPGFNAAFGAQGAIYYAIASSEEDVKAIPAFYKINADASGRQTILNKEVWTAYRTDYTTLTLQTEAGWYSYNVATAALGQIESPSNFMSRGYIDQPATKQSLWVDTQGGQGVLHLYDRTTGKDSSVLAKDGLGYPIRWLDASSAIFRVVTAQEIADYVVSTSGTQPAYKISTVSNSFGLSQSQ